MTKESYCFFCHEAERGQEPLLCGKCVARLAGAPDANLLTTAVHTQAKVDHFTEKGIPVFAPTEKKERKKRQKKDASDKPASKTKGFGRGWHLMARFVAPNGDVYSKGKLISA